MPQLVRAVEKNRGTKTKKLGIRYTDSMRYGKQRFSQTAYVD